MVLQQLTAALSSCDLPSSSAMSPTSPAQTQTIATVPPIITEFTLFPKLPVELRNKILKHCLPPSRIIQLTKETYWLDQEPWAPRCVYDPSILLASKDIRQDMLRFLKLLKGSTEGC